MVIEVAQNDFNRRSPYGERGLKFFGAPADGIRQSRSPYGERGLK